MHPTGYKEESDKDVAKDLDAFLLSEDCYGEFKKMFSDKLGIDKNGKSYYEVGEIKEGEDWTGRSWKTNVGLIGIKRLNGWFQMYFFPENGNDKEVKEQDKLY